MDIRQMALQRDKSEVLSRILQIIPGRPWESAHGADVRVHNAITAELQETFEIENAIEKSIRNDRVEVRLSIGSGKQITVVQSEDTDPKPREYWPEGLGNWREIFASWDRTESATELPDTQHSHE